MILDGWGCGDHHKDDVIFNTPTPYWDSLLANYPHSQLQASGENVGLPDGQMGNSEVGHLNIGAGRIVYQDLVKINRACADGSIMQNPEVVSAFTYAKENGKNIHFMGLTSNGGVHSSLDHLFRLCDIAKEYGIENTFIHCFMDGRDTDPKSGKGFIEELTAHCAKSAGKIASIVGRFYAMDRDKRWERVKEAYDLLVNGTTPSLIIGGTTSPMNAGNVSNKGWELELGWRDHIGDFQYSIRGNLATLKNKVTYLDPSLTRLNGVNFHTNTITFFEEGYPVYYFRGYKFKGLDENGNPMFHDLDNSGTLNDGDLAYIGDAIPDFTYGLTLTAAWKGFDLTVFATGSQGNDIFNCINRSDIPTYNKMKEVFYDNRWTAANPNGTVPRAGADNMDKYCVSDALVYDGSFFKIKQIQLGYSIPKQLLKKVCVNNLRLYASLDDFFTFTKYPGFDPEASANSTSGMGVDKGAYPSSKKVVLGFNIEF